MKNKFLDLITSAVSKEALKKLIFSKPDGTEVTKITARLCTHRGRRVLALEYSLPGNTVSQKNINEADIPTVLLPLFNCYRQINLITAPGDAEYKSSKSGKEIILGYDKLKRSLDGNAPAFESAIEELDRKKDYILSGEERFLITLGISDKSGRVHDKKQGKFRQINRFLEHIESIYEKLPKCSELIIYDLCCGKSYLSFAVYYYLTEIKCHTVKLLGIDLKRDVIAWCSNTARELGYSGMHFICDNISNTPKNPTPDMVISLHACDIATDMVLNRAVELGARIILSTPCCHRAINDYISADALRFITDYPHIKNKLGETVTDSIRLARLSANGYKVSALELTDPENTPKNTLIRAIREDGISEAELLKRKEKYEDILNFILGEKKEEYLKKINL